MRAFVWKFYLILSGNQVVIETAVMYTNLFFHFHFDVVVNQQYCQLLND